MAIAASVLVTALLLHGGHSLLLATVAGTAAYAVVSMRAHA